MQTSLILSIFCLFTTGITILVVGRKIWTRQNISQLSYSMICLCFGVVLLTGGIRSLCFALGFGYLNILFHYIGHLFILVPLSLGMYWIFFRVTKSRLVANILTFITLVPGVVGAILLAKNNILGPNGIVGPDVFTSWGTEFTVPSQIEIWYNLHFGLFIIFFLADILLQIGKWVKTKKMDVFRIMTEVPGILIGFGIIDIFGGANWGILLSRTLPLIGALGLYLFITSKRGEELMRENALKM